MKNNIDDLSDGASVQTADAELENKIQDFRKRLLDKSNKNKLINFSHSPRGRRIIRIVDEIPAQIYSRLVEEEKEMSFKSLPKFDEPKDELSEEFQRAFEKEYARHLREREKSEAERQILVAHSDELEDNFNDELSHDEIIKIERK